MRTLILAGSFGEAARYARGKSLNHYRYASSAELVGAFQAQRVVELPGFARRMDRHALIAVANRAVRRGAEWVKDEYVPPAPEETPITKLRAMTPQDWMFGDVPVEAKEPKKPEPKPAAKPKRPRPAAPRSSDVDDLFEG